MHPLWISFGTALAASFLLTPLAGWAAWKLGIVDRPDGVRKLQKAPVPLLGGVAVYLALAAALAAVRLGALQDVWRLEHLGNALMAAAGLVALAGLYDDRRNLRPRFKLILQFAAVLPVALAGYTVDRISLLGYSLELGWLGVPLTVCWLVGCINALNLLDGMDGLASTVGITAAMVTAIIAMLQGHVHVAIIAVALAGALAGFLAYNLPPARIYLGDCGSMVIGLVVGMLAMQSSLKSAATLSLVTPAVVMTIPMLDILLAVVRRRLTGQSIATADRGHIHHRLLQRGLSTWQALCVMGGLCIATGAAAAIGTLLKSEVVTLATVLVLLAILIRMRALAEHELKLVRQRIVALLVAATGWMLAPRWRRRYEMADLAAEWCELLFAMRRRGVIRLEYRLCFAGELLASGAWSAPGRVAPFPEPTARKDASEVALRLPIVQTTAGTAGWELTLRLGHGEAGQCEFRLVTAAVRPPLWTVLYLYAALAGYATRWSRSAARMAAPSSLPQPAQPRRKAA